LREREDCSTQVEREREGGDCTIQVERRLSQPVYCTATTFTYREWRYQMLCIYNLISWRWAYYCSKPVM
jgi:hypothetical protein